MSDLTRKEDLLKELEKAISEDALVELFVALWRLANQYRDEVIRLKKRLEESGVTTVEGTSKTGIKFKMTAPPKEKYQQLVDAARKVAEIDTVYGGDTEVPNELLENLRAVLPSMK